MKQAIHPNQVDIIHSAFAPNGKGTSIPALAGLKKRLMGRYPKSSPDSILIRTS
jgi:hypothetical protein